MEVRGQIAEMVLSLCPVSSKNQAQVIRLSSKHFYLLSHFVAHLFPQYLGPLVF